MCAATPVCKFPQDFAGSAAARDEISEILVGDWVCILVDNTVENKTCRRLAILIVEEIDGSKISGKILECSQDTDYLIWNRAHVGNKFPTLRTKVESRVWH